MAMFPVSPLEAAVLSQIFKEAPPSAQLVWDSFTWSQWLFCRGINATFCLRNLTEQYTAAPRSSNEWITLFFCLWIEALCTLRIISVLPHYVDLEAPVYDQFHWARVLKCDQNMQFYYAFQSHHVSTRNPILKSFEKYAFLLHISISSRQYKKNLPKSKALNLMTTEKQAALCFTCGMLYLLVISLDFFSKHC